MSGAERGAKRGYWYSRRKYVEPTKFRRAEEPLKSGSRSKQIIAEKDEDETSSTDACTRLSVWLAFRGATNTPSTRTLFCYFPGSAGARRRERAHTHERRKSRWRVKVDGKRGTEKHMRASSPEIPYKIYLICIRDTNLAQSARPADGIQNSRIQMPRATEIDFIEVY